MTEGSKTLCTLYVSQSNIRRLLYVKDSACFPDRMFNADDWRMVARGVEPPPSGEVSLNRHTYYPSWLPRDAKPPR